LKDKADEAQAECGARVAAGCPWVNALDEHRSSRRPIENPQQMKQRRLSTSAWAHDRDRVARYERQARSSDHGFVATPTDQPVRN
jgi:hypothetical protein